MKHLFVSFLFLFSLSNLFAQDDYHNSLNTYIQTEYNVSPGDWLFFDNEANILADNFQYGVNVTNENISGQPFSTIERISIGQAGNNVWDAGWGIRNNISVGSGDIVLFAFYLRSVGGTGSVNFFVENVSTFAKEAYLTLSTTEEWTRYFITFESQDAYNIDQLNCGFHVAAQAQTIDIGGFTAMNYNNSTTLDNLPNDIGNDQYGGYEPDAPWRALAADRIENLRKADLTVNVKNTANEPIENAAIQVTMLQHDYGFGSAINANRLAGNNAHNIIYENKIINLDGAGHGFNCVVFENDMKWPGWEDGWFVSKPELVDAVQFLRDNKIKIRGHTLVWPGADNLPDDVAANISDIPFVKNRIDEHIESILNYPGIAGEVAEWDVLNEIVTNTSIQNAFSGQAGYPTGREIYPEIFEKAKLEDPNIGLWLNDYITISLNQGAGSTQYDNLKSYAQEIIDAGAQLDGIGFQAHVGGFPTGIPDVLSTLDDFSTSLGVKTKITEFDMPEIVNEELAATYLRDILTANFSHPSSDGFIFWSFWDGATYMNPAANLYREDWSETPAHAAFVDLLFNEWWTNELFQSDFTGVANDRVFKGRYEISYECNGETIRDTISITEATDYEICYVLKLQTLISDWILAIYKGFFLWRWLRRMGYLRSEY